MIYYLTPPVYCVCLYILFCFVLFFCIKLCPFVNENPIYLKVCNKVVYKVYKGVDNFLFNRNTDVCQ